MIKAVIFDFDGVLVESVDIKTGAFRRLFEPFGKDVVKKVTAYHLANTGVSRFDKFRYIYSNILKKELPDGTFTGLCDRFANLVLDEVVKAPYVEGAKEFLDRYAPHYKFFISSATPQGEIEEIVKKRMMVRYFSGVCGAPKTKTEIVKDIISGHGLLPQEGVYIGDAISDYTAASASGVRFVARINNNESIFKNIRCAKVKNLTKFYDLLETM